MRSKWWGWGEKGKTYAIPDEEAFWGYVHSRLGSTEPSPRLDSLKHCVLPPSRVPKAAVSALEGALGKGNVSTETGERAALSLGKGYKDLLRVRRGEVPSPTDAVVRPQTEEQVRHVVDLGSREGFSVIPIGGGTSVVGGIEPSGDGPAISLDLEGLNHIVRIDQVSGTATVEAGVFGPDLERQLQSVGWTLGHFPQSFEFSTVGGWVATRSAGQNSTRYGRIEERVQSLRLAYPGGILTTPAVPATASGPDLVQMVCGSEGALGVITQVTLRLARAPVVQDYRAYAFRDFAEGVAAARELMQAGLEPAAMRLSDEPETESTLALRPPPRGLGAHVERAGRWYLAGRGLHLESAALMILGFEGEPAAVKHQWSRARQQLRRFNVVSLGRGPGRAWQRSRFEAPYLRDVFLDHGIMVDTLETATTWDRYLDLHATVRDALRSALGERSVVMAHLSHSYSDGGSIYYTFLAPQDRTDDVGQWEWVKTAATDAIVRNGGALSHHHGIGSEHRPWMKSYLGDDGVRLLGALKSALDPRGVMNPGKLFATPEPPSDEAEQQRGSARD